MVLKLLTLLLTLAHATSDCKTQSKFKWKNYTLLNDAKRIAVASTANKVWILGEK